MTKKKQSTEADLDDQGLQAEVLPPLLCGLANSACLGTFLLLGATGGLSIRLVTSTTRSLLFRPVPLCMIGDLGMVADSASA